MFLYPMFIAFILVFISELGDKTQLLVLSFSTKSKTMFILIGVALGSFLSHGIAILLGSRIGLLENLFFHDLLQILTYLTFIFFGILSFLPPKDKIKSDSERNKVGSYLSCFRTIFMIAFSIAIGELGDKTFLASIGLGISYPSAKFSLILGAILGMLVSDSFAILCGKFLSTKISEKSIRNLSGVIFLIFGFAGLIGEFVM